MIRFAMVRAEDGMVTKVIGVSDLETLGVNIPEGHEAHPCFEMPVVPFSWRLDGQALVEIPAPVQPIADAQDARWEEVKAARDKAEWSGCASPLGRVDTDPDSQRKVSGSVQMAMIAQAAGEPFAVPWTMQNDTTVSHDANAMILMGVAVGQHVADCHAVARQKKVAIYATGTREELMAIDVEGGWPDA